MDPALVEVDGQRVVGQVGVVDAKAADALAARPFGEVAEIFGQAVDKALGRLAHADGGRLTFVARGRVDAEGLLRTRDGGIRAQRFRDARRKRRGRVDGDFQEPTFDGAVEEDVATARAQADFLGQFEVAGEDKTGPAAEALFEDIAEAPIEPSEGADVAQALAVGRVGHENAALDGDGAFARRELALLKAEVFAESCPSGVGARGTDGCCVHVEPFDADFEVARTAAVALLCLGDKFAPERRVVLTPAHEPHGCAQKPGRDIGRHKARLNRQRSRTAHRIDEAAPLPREIAPAGDGEDGRRQILLEGRDRALNAVAAAVQALAGEVHAQGGDILEEAGVDPEVGPFEVDAGARAVRLAELVDDGVLDLERAEMGVRDSRSAGAEIDRQSAVAAQVFPPIDATRALVERLGGGRLEGGEVEKHAAGDARPEAGAVADGEGALEGHTGAFQLDTAGAKARQLVGEGLLHPLGRCCEIAM